MKFVFRAVCGDLINSTAARVFRSKLATLAGFGIAVFLVSGSVGSVAAQQSSEPALASAAIAERTTASEDTRYKIGAGDVLTVLVRKAPELSMEAVRVDQRGMIRLPMIDGDVMAACRTESQLAAQIATLYLEYKKNPSVQVFIREFQARPVSVIGAVNAPGQFRLQRQVRLLELLSYAGGHSGAAGRIINVIHTGGSIICQKDGNADKAITAEGLVTFKLTDTLKGNDEANPFVQPGDIVSLPEADQVFVVGYVYSPRAIPLKDKPITVSRAIAMAGGPQREGKTSQIHIVRQASDGKKQDIIVDLTAIRKEKAEDILLLPNDIVEVPASTGKILLNALTGALGPALSQGVVRVIP